MRGRSEGETEIKGFSVLSQDPHGAVPARVNRVKGGEGHGAWIRWKNWICGIIGESGGNQVFLAARDISSTIQSYASEEGRSAPHSARRLAVSRGRRNKEDELAF